MVMISIAVPRRLIDRARELGVDLESIAIEAILRELKLDPGEEAEVHLELARRYLSEAKAYISRRDAVQASEKLYKAVEECIKALAKKLGVPEAAKAREYGRWFTWLLDKAARRLARVLNEYRVKSVWDAAYSAHVWGFHEAKLSIKDIEIDIPQVEWMLKYTEKLVKGRNTGTSSMRPKTREEPEGRR